MQHSLVDIGYIAKVRPCLVVSIPALNQDRALATLLPPTTSLRGSRFEVKVKNKFLREGVFDVQNTQIGKSDIRENARRRIGNIFLVGI
ncbi:MULTISPECIES: type II toxin-antitoxin system PemK/MazF family toxin [unclassified Microcoleus]|uniref:type II toxin-antitoxin system PemK/MazF family toxin n=1 Tax=unclassified Microcoleus TaxID=2642155 RepID=UPI002FD34CE5